MRRLLIFYHFWLARARNRFHRIDWKRLRSFRAFNIALCLAYGTWIINPDVTTLANSASWHWMAQQFDEVWWGLLWITTGGASLTSYIRRDERLRVLSGLVALFLWSMLAFLVLITAPWSTGVPVYVIIAAFKFIDLAGVEDEPHRHY